MGIEIILKVAGIGILVAIACQLLKQSGRDDIAMITETNAASAEENEAISEQLISCAETLKQTVSDFRLKGDE